MGRAISKAGAVVLSLLVLAGNLLPPARAEVPPLVFVSRELHPAPKPDARQDPVERAVRGRLLVYDSAGGVRALVDAASRPGAGLPVDVMDPDVSYAGDAILFSGYLPSESAWRIFEIRADGSGLRQITRSDRQIDLSRYGKAAPLFQTYDDLDPCYLPGGRICFVSTRYPGVAPDGRLRATNLYVANGDGTGVHRITTERFGADTPVVEPSTGRIVYSRWWRTAQPSTDPSSPAPAPIPPGSPGYGGAGTDESNLVLRGLPEEKFPGVNSWFLAGIDPDGTDLAMYSGFRLDRALTQAYRPAFTRNGQALALFIPQTPFYGYPRGNGLRLLTAGPSRPQELGGPQSFPSFFGVGGIVDPPIPPEKIPFLFASAAELSDGRLLVTAADRRVGLDYGIYLQNPDEVPVEYLNLAGTAELDAVPLTARAEPPILPDRVTATMAEEAPVSADRAYAEGGSFVFLCENIHLNPPVDVPVASAPPIGKRLKIEFYLSPQRESSAASDPPILIRSLEVPSDGRIRTELPAGVPLFEVLRRPDGSIPLGRDGQIFHVGGMNFGRAGETNRCVGCHAGHSQMAVPSDTAWTNIAPSAIVRSSGSRQTADLTLGGFFQDSNLIDRQTGDPSAEWAAVGKEGPNIEFLWSAMVRARQVVIYPPRPGKGQFGERSLVIQNLWFDLLAGRQVLKRVYVNQDLRPEGTAVEVDAALEFNHLRMVIEGFSGLYEGEPGAALAEVEVIGRAVSAPTSIFLRGDADCNGQIDLTDVIRILASRFLGNGPLCCEAGADANGDGNLDVSDPVYLLWFMFLGKEPPPPPFPGCEPTRESASSCEVEACF